MIYPVDSDGYPPFEQLGPGVLRLMHAQCEFIKEETIDTLSILHYPLPSPGKGKGSVK